jgi:hypothetical protein
MNRALASLSAVALAALLAGCAGMTSLSTKSVVKETWTDPKYKDGPVKTIFVVSLMKVEPGGRGAVEDAIVAQLKSAGVAATASHTVMPADFTDKPNTLTDAIRNSGAEAVLLAQVKYTAAYEPYIVGETVMTPSSDRMAYFEWYKNQGANQPTDYKTARIETDLYIVKAGTQVWAAYTDAYDANQLARNVHDFAQKMVGALAKDRLIASPPKPAS